MSKLEYIKKLINDLPDDVDLEVVVSQGIKEVEPENGFKVFKKTDGKTIVIKVNGGSKSFEVEYNGVAKRLGENPKYV